DMIRISSLKSTKTPSIVSLFSMSHFAQVVLRIKVASSALTQIHQEQSLSLPDRGRFSLKPVAVNLKSNLASRLPPQSVNEWLRRLGGCSQPRNSGRDGKSSGGPMHPTSDECLDWITNPTRFKERHREKPSY